MFGNLIRNVGSNSQTNLNPKLMTGHGHEYLYVTPALERKRQEDCHKFLGYI